MHSFVHKLNPKGLICANSAVISGDDFFNVANAFLSSSRDGKGPSFELLQRLYNFFSLQILILIGFCIY